jgi:hypothetical protein
VTGTSHTFSDEFMLRSYNPGSVTVILQTVAESGNHGPGDSRKLIVCMKVTPALGWQELGLHP